MRDDLRTRLLTGLRRGAAAGALAGGLTLIALVFLWAISLTIGVGGISTTVLLGLPVGISMGWILGLFFGGLCGACGGVLRAWSSRRLPSVIAGGLLGFLFYSLGLWSVLVSVSIKSKSPAAELVVLGGIAMAFGVLGVIPGVCGAFWGQRKALPQSNPPH